MAIGFLLFFGWFALALCVGCAVFVPLRPRAWQDSAPDLADGLFAMVFLGTLVIGWVALVLLQFGWFSPWRVFGSSLSIGLATLFIARRFGRGIKGLHFQHSRFTWACLALLIAAIALYFRPAEFILGGGDAGVYVNLGAIWADTGSFEFTESGLSSLPQELWPGLFRQTSQNHVVDYIRLPGFYLSNADSQTIVPQFFPLHPVWISLANGIAGLRASLFMTPLWASLGVLSVVLAVRQLFGPKIGILAGILLLVTPLQIYFARYSTAEALTQFLLWGGLYSFIAFTANGGRLWGFMAGVALGQVFLTRIDALPLLLVPGVRLLITFRQRSWRRDSWFLIPFSVLLAQSVYQSLVLSWPYTWDVYRGLISWVQVLFARYWWSLPVVLGLGGCAYLGWTRLGEGRSRVVAAMKWGGSVLLVALSAYAYFVWPKTGETIIAHYWYGSTTIPIQNHLNLVRLGWYLSPLGVWLGILGICWIISREDFGQTWAVLGVGLSFSLFYLYNIMNNPYHIYAMRRYVPVVLPFFTVGMAYFIGSLGALRSRWRIASWAAVLLFVILIGWIGYNDRSVWNMVEFQGVQVQLETLAEELEPNAVLLFDDTPVVGVGSTIGTPLQYVFGFTVFDLQEELLDLESLTEAVGAWQADGRTVYWVEGPDPYLGIPEDLESEAYLGTWISYPRLEGSYDRFPEARLTSNVPLEFHRFNAAADSEPCRIPLTVDVGTLDMHMIVGGFYAKELLGDRSVRWTDGEAIIHLPCVPVTESDAVVLTVRVASVRSPDIPAASLELLVGTTVLGRFTLANDFRDYQVEVPRSLLAENDGRIVLLSDTWVPQEYGVGLDRRDLGVLLDTIVVSPLEPTHD